jgi:hypothetical protein
LDHQEKRLTHNPPYRPKVPYRWLIRIDTLEICEERSLAAGWRTLGNRLSRRLWLLQSEALLTEARRRTGLEDFGNPALSILVKSLELEADLHPLGRFLMRVHLRELLETRLRLAQAWSGQLEDLESSVIQRPISLSGCREVVPLFYTNC